MKLFTKSLLLVGGVIGNTLARNVQFSVISWGADVKVKVGESIVQMTKPDPSIPIWTVTADVPDNEIK